MGKQNYQALNYRLLFTVEQAGLVLGIARQKVEQLIDDGEIAIVTKFGGTRIPKSELEILIAKNLKRKAV